MKKGIKILHFAPSAAIERWIIDNCPNADYESTDLYKGIFRKKFLPKIAFSYGMYEKACPCQSVDQPVTGVKPAVVVLPESFPVFSQIKKGRPDDEPLVSVIMTAYNHEAFLPEIVFLGKILGKPSHNFRGTVGRTVVRHQKLDIFIGLVYHAFYRFRNRPGCGGDRRRVGTYRGGKLEKIRAGRPLQALHP